MMTTNKNNTTDLEHKNYPLKTNVQEKDDNITDIFKYVDEHNENNEETETEDDDENCSDTNQVCDMEDDDDERDLTNLTWLTKLRNQSIGFVSIITDEEPRIKHNSLSVSNDQQITLPLVSHSYPCTRPNLLCTLTGNTLEQNKQKKKIKITNKKLEELQNAVKISNQCKRPSPTERYEIFLTKIKRDFEIYQESSTNFQLNAIEKPPFNYSHIIGMAMLDSGRRMTLQQICSWIERKFAFFRVRKKWNNSIRHNLSLHSCFRKMGRNKGDKGKGGYWELGVDPKKCERKRIRNRKNIGQATKLTRKNVQSQYVKSLKRRQQKSPNTKRPNELFEVNATKSEYEELILDDMDVQQNVDVACCSSSNCCILSSYKSSNNRKKESFVQSCFNDDTQNIKENHALQEVKHKLSNQFDINDNNHKEEKVSDQSYQHQFDYEVKKQYKLGTSISNLTNVMIVEVPKIQSLQHQNIINTEADVWQNNNSHRSDLPEEYNDDETKSIQCGHHSSLNLLSSIRLEMNAFSTQSIQPNIMVEHIVQPSPNVSVIGISSNILATSAQTSSREYSNELCTENFRPYIDGIDEAFQYLRSIDTRNEDILDNLLDISVSDY